MPDRHPWAYLIAVLLIYGGGYCLFPPAVFISADESAYVEQAVVFADRSLAVVSPSPPGTSLLQAAFVALAGWRGAIWVSLLSAALTVLLMARWLRDAGYHSGFALLFLAYAPTLVMARIGSSELPSTAMVALGLWLYWTGEGQRWKWAVAGAVGGLSVLLRETNVVLFLPFVVAAIVRRRPGATVLTGFLGAGLLAAALVYELTAATFPGLRDTAGWSLDGIQARAVLYAVCTSILVPGGLAAIVAYQGRERHPLIAAVGIYLAIYLFYDYSASDSDRLARFATIGRYLVPLIPLMTLAWADSVSRIGSAVPIGRVTLAAFMITASAAFAVHPVLRARSLRDQEIVRQIATTASRGAVIADDSQRKYVAPVFGEFHRYWIRDTAVRDLPLVIARHPSAYIVHVGRFQTPAVQDVSVDAPLYLEAAARACRIEPVVDRTFADRRRLQIWRVSSCGDVLPA
jgi:hypothetical protein